MSHIHWKYLNPYKFLRNKLSTFRSPLCIFFLILYYSQVFTVSLCSVLPIGNGDNQLGQTHRMKERRFEKDGSFPSLHAFHMWECVKHSTSSKHIAESDEMLRLFSLLLSWNGIVVKTSSLYPDWCSSPSCLFLSSRTFFFNLFYF